MIEIRRGRVRAGVLSAARPLIVGTLGVVLALSACGGGAADAPTPPIAAAEPSAPTSIRAETVPPPTPPSTSTPTILPTTATTPTTFPTFPTLPVLPTLPTLPLPEATFPADSTPGPVEPAPLEPVAEPASPEIVAVLPNALRGSANPVRVLVAGDSTGVELSIAMGAYAAAHPDQIQTSHSAFAGCGLSVADDGRLHAWNTPTEWLQLGGCTLQWKAIPQRVAENRIDVVLVSIGPWDGTDILLPDGTVVSVLDPVGRALVEQAYEQFVVMVRATGATPLFIRPATIDAEWERRIDPLDDPRRWEIMREIVDSLGAAQIDLPRFLAANGLDGAPGRPDGVHLAADVQDRFIAEVVVPELMRLAYV